MAERQSVGQSAATGSRTVKTEPLRGSVVTVTSPPIMRASLRVMAKGYGNALNRVQAAPRTISADPHRRRWRDEAVFLYAFDLIELTGDDRRRDPLEQRKLDLSRLLAKAGPGLRLNEWIDGGEHDGATISFMPASWASKAL